MSDTERYVRPGWGPGHPQWYFGFVSDKFLHKDRRGLHLKGPGKFTNHCKNCWFNLRHKNEDLQKKEALEDT